MSLDCASVNCLVVLIGERLRIMETCFEEAPSGEWAPGLRRICRLKPGSDLSKDRCSMKQVFIPVFALLAIVTLAVVATMPSSSLEADHFQRFRDGKSLYSILSSSVNSGDSLQDVEALIGAGNPVVEGREELVIERREAAQWHPQTFPEGVYETDTFVTWPIGDDSVTLQFRNGILVNHDPRFYLDYQLPHDISGRSSDDEDFQSDTSSIGGDIGGQE